MSSESSTFNGKSPQVSVKHGMRLLKLVLRQNTGTSPELLTGKGSTTPYEGICIIFVIWGFDKFEEKIWKNG
ncbi:hypothetical protein Hanom_Chr14g01331681 [Helianthus anomalus]